MEGETSFEPGNHIELKVEDDEDEFQSCVGDETELEEKAESSCCEDENELEDKEESVEESIKDFLDELSVKMFFKGVSIAVPGDSGLSGIGVFMERPAEFPVIQVQKKLDFYVEESVADYLALMDGLVEALHNDIKRVQAFTDSETLFNQITSGTKHDSPLLLALSERILEHANRLDFFYLKYVPDIDIRRPLQLAQIAVGIVSFPAKEDAAVESCCICGKEKLAPMMITVKCSHKICSHCIKTYVDGKVQGGHVPIRCPQPKCRYYISASECRSFLPFTSYKLLEMAISKANVLNSDKIYCPFSNCSVLVNTSEGLSASSSSPSQSDNSCLECPVCEREICVNCGVPWHSTITCEEYQSLPFEERNADDISLHHLAQNKRWRQCEECRRMIELTHGCYHMSCWCGHEFCYSCGAEYIDAQQMCECAFWNDNYSGDVITHPSQQFEQWAWESFGSLSTMMDAYSEQERSQLALIQRFLAGGFSSSDHQTDQYPPHHTDSYVDSMKDLRQVPWLERFVSVISDNYYDEYS